MVTPNALQNRKPYVLRDLMNFYQVTCLAGVLGLVPPDSDYYNTYLAWCQ